jgi:hypothetical protein
MPPTKRAREPGSGVLVAAILLTARKGIDVESGISVEGAEL